MGQLSLEKTFLLAAYVEVFRSNLKDVNLTLTNGSNLQGILYGEVLAAP